MSESPAQFQFRLRSLFVAMFVVALIAGAWQWHPLAGVWMIYLQMLILVMWWYRWSDAAMATCLVLFVVGMLLGFCVLFPPIAKAENFDRMTRDLLLNTETVNGHESKRPS